jgi:hypothetical protein
MWYCGLFAWGLKVIELRNYVVPLHYEFCCWCCAYFCQTALACVQTNTQWCVNCGQNVLVNPLWLKCVGAHTVAKTLLCADCGQYILVCRLWPKCFGEPTVAKPYWCTHCGQYLMACSLWPNCIGLHKWPNVIGVHTVANTLWLAHCGQNILVCPLWPRHTSVPTVA